MRSASSRLRGGGAGEGRLELRLQLAHHE